VYWCVVTIFGSIKVLQNVGNFIPLYTARQEDREDVSSYLMTLRKEKILELERGCIRFPSGKLDLEESMDPS
jgi:hypothetical protein